MTTDAVLTLDEVEVRHVLGVLSRVGWNRWCAAVSLGVPGLTLYRRLAGYEARGLIAAVPGTRAFRLVESQQGGGQ